MDDPDKPGLLYYDTIAVGEQVLRVVYQGPPLVSAMVFEGLWLLLRKLPHDGCIQGLSDRVPHFGELNVIFHL